ncbi:MAG: hypothetical protein BroJett030_28340 [Alphaproteobacteria bacterium]|nr:MAG: hypothetical protein BroJett030_28340 [Alphaproteobacteria bacterium]
MSGKTMFALIGATLALAGCQEYLARQDLATPYSGDAIARNNALQMRDPWPRYVYDTRIPTSGKRQSNIHDRYTSFGEEAPTTELKPLQLVVGGPE